jgi:DMSO/TMAO reductase YedYZ molybdopterin-dependent catalytic subunit
LGLALGVAFGICFVTGLISHLIQQPPDWFGWPSRPVWLYRVTQGLHVATGLASVPLLGAKLWSVYPRLFAWPPVRDLGHLVVRLSVLALVAAALFQVVTGVLNIARWYTPMPFGFTSAHYWTAWLAVGAILVHVAVKLPVIRQALRHRPERSTSEGPVLTRRGVLAAVGGTVAVTTLATVGQTVAPLSRLSVLAPRVPDVGPQSLPVNTSAERAGVTALARDPAYRLMVAGPGGEVLLSLDDLAGLAQRTVRLPITCVEGWSADAEWTGVRLSDLLASVGAGDGTRSVWVESLQPAGAYRTSIVESPHLRDPLTLLALRLNGEPLHIDHGYPCRLIAPNRPGVMQTKWVGAVRVRS